VVLLNYFNSIVELYFYLFSSKSKNAIRLCLHYQVNLLFSLEASPPHVYHEMTNSLGRLLELCSILQD